MRSTRLLALYAVGVCVACGSSPASPFTGTPTLLSVTIAMNTPGVGSTVQAAATANLTSNLSTVITTGFSGDAPTVATVTAAGAVSGLKIGDVTVAVDYQGMRATKRLRILPNYAGLFEGTYTVDACVETQAWIGSGTCAQVTVGSTFAIRLLSNQSADLTAIGGLLVLGAIQSSINAASVAPDGALSMTSFAVSGTSRLDVLAFAATSPAPGQIAGTFVQQYSDAFLAGNARVTCTLLTLTRTAGGTAPASIRTFGNLTQLIAAVFTRTH